MDLFDDLFQNKSSLQEILREAQTQLSPDDFQKFKVYREKRLASIPPRKPAAVYQRDYSQRQP